MNVLSGPPPRVWGIRKLYGQGKGDHTVHPHACGEYEPGIPPVAQLIGPPPRVWGIRCYLDALAMVQPVHPHACGEYSRFGHQA